MYLEPRYEQERGTAGGLAFARVCAQVVIRHLAGAAAALLGAFAASSPAMAVSCAISPLTGSYGTVDILSGAAVDATATITVTCSGGLLGSVRLCINIGSGTTAVGPANERTIRTAADFIDAEFYSDAARTQIWGSWGTGAATNAYPVGSPAGIQRDVSLPALTTQNFTYTVYARLAAGQATKRPGSYSWTSNSPTVQYSELPLSACPLLLAPFANASGSSFTATVNANGIVTGAALNFGSATSIPANIDAATTITVRATNTTPYTVGLGNGLNASGAQRRMRLGATSNYMNYGLYTDAARTNAWSTTTSATTCTGGASTCVTGTGAGIAQNVTIYGRVPPQTPPAAGTFTDTVVITVTF